MSRRKGGARVLGPYEENDGWRVVSIDDDGNRESLFFKTKAEAMDRKNAGAGEPGVRKIERTDGIRWQAYGSRSGKKVYVGTFGTEKEAADARREFNDRQREASGRIIAVKIYAVHENKAESLLVHDTLAEFRTYEFDADGPVGVWLQRLTTALPVQPAGVSDEDFARWYYDDEPLPAPTSTKEVPF